jgi:hypothetical protein
MLTQTICQKEFDSFLKMCKCLAMPKKHTSTKPLKLKQVRVKQDIYEKASLVKTSLPPKRSLEEIINHAALIGLTEMFNQNTSYPDRHTP